MSPLVTLLILGLLLVVVIVLLVWAIATAALGARSARTQDRREAPAREAHPRDSRRGTERRVQAKDTDVRPDEGHRRERSSEPEPAPALRPAVARRSNDDIRGAKAAPRPSVPDDAFERFLRSGRDDER